MLNAIIIIVALLLAGYLAFSKRLAASSNWKATVTPLASIMGSGFLVSAPLLAGIVGNLLQQGLIGRTPRGVSNKSVKGWPLGRVVEYEEFKEPLTFQFVTWTWVREMWLPVWREHLKDSPFVLTWEKTTYQNELHLVEATAGFETPHRSGQWATLSLSVQGLANE